MLFLHDPEEILFPPLTNDDNFNAESREEGQIVNSCGMHDITERFGMSNRKLDWRWMLNVFCQTRSAERS